MKERFKTALFFLFLILPLGIIFPQSVGETIFNKTCKACHTIGLGKLVGPDLANVRNRRSDEWLLKFIKSSQTVIKSGDSIAVAVFNENNKFIMPDQQLSDSEIKSILDYITINSPDPNDPNKKTPNQIFNAAAVTERDIERGKELFEGTRKFKNGGVPCIACHSVQMNGVFNGGLLAKDLSTAMTRLTPAGIDGILRGLPFPAMAKSFGEHPLTDDEIKDLLAYLYKVDEWNLYQNYAGDGNIDFYVASVVGLNIVFFLFLLNWRKVKKNSVNLFNN